jgi:5-methylcytosine-specific restriction endonuclease McrA
MKNLQQDLDHLRQLDDESLLSSLKRHVGSSNRLNALVLAHLAEVDARGAYRKWACETLAAYCVYELRLSEDEAQRRCRAARVMRQFPVLFEMVADASIHLTGILMLAPYLTADNHQGVLVRARYRRKREIERLVAELAPACDVPALVQPLGVVTGSRTVPSKGWAALTESTLGWVRQLEPGDGPVRAPSTTDSEHGKLMSALEAAQDGGARSHAEEASVEQASDGHTETPVEVAGLGAPNGAAPARSESDAPSGGPLQPQLRFKVQFTADQAYVDLLERAKALLWHQLPSGDLVELQRLALEALVEKLQQRKCGTLARANAKQSAPTNADAANTAAPARNQTPPPPSPSATAPARNEPSRPSSRHIPRAVRRQVWERDAGRCTFVDERGVRCRAVSAIEFHHEHPHARGGPATLSNLSLRCRAHNQLAAEQDFGRAFMQAVGHGDAVTVQRSAHQRSGAAGELL